MKQIVHHEQCRRCRECCRFRANREDFAPIFTVKKSKRSASSASAISSQCRNSPRSKATTNILQIRLKKRSTKTRFIPSSARFLTKTTTNARFTTCARSTAASGPSSSSKYAKPANSARTLHGDACLALQEVSPGRLRRIRGLHARTRDQRRICWRCSRLSRLDLGE